jgi:glutamyl-tRNA(Gln) amidotransferase subunit E
MRFREIIFKKIKKNKMQKPFNSLQNYNETKQKIGYVTRKEATQEDYNRIGFMSGLEVHQQLKTKEKLFCHCPAGVYHKNDVYDAEVIRHMRPTLSELGEYDGTALMEFKTRKEIIYRIKNETTCTYEVDDTPPFPINREALGIAIEISLLSKLNIVGEVHITRKQYLDGSIPTGFQRTAIIGVEGEIYPKNKRIRLIQLSIEEDSCREISDIGHTRIYKTDRLGMPLIETVTYPDMINPDEVMEACNYIRFLNRSTGKVRTGIGAGRQDVNVSCRGGHRVEIKGVAHTSWIPELTHNECFRQWALLNIKKILNERMPDFSGWKISYKEILSENFENIPLLLYNAYENNKKVFVVNIPHFKGILSHFTQPGQSFQNEISDRLKVIACIEKPNMTSSEAIDKIMDDEELENIIKKIPSEEEDAQIIFWGPEADIKTALETIEERCKMAFEGVPPETRKSLSDGITIFERVLPGADRMYPDTDSAPIPLDNNYIEDLGKNLPDDIIERYKKMQEWQIPENTYKYIFSKNMFPVILKIINELGVPSRFTGAFFGHTLKFVEGHYIKGNEFEYEMIYNLFKYIKQKNLDYLISVKMLPVIFEHPKMDFDSVLTTINFKKIDKKDIISKIPFLKEKFSKTVKRFSEKNEDNWIMGQLRKAAIGNVKLKELYEAVKTINHNK